MIELSNHPDHKTSNLVLPDRAFLVKKKLKLAI